MMCYLLCDPCFYWRECFTFFFFEAVGKHPSKHCKKTKKFIKDAAPSKSRPVVHRGMKFVHNLYAHVTCLFSKS